MQTIPQQRRSAIAAWDLETTGVDTEKDRIVQIGIVYTDHDFNVISEPKRILINPGMPIPPKSTEIHGITDEMVKDAPRFEDVAGHFYNALDPFDWLFYNGAQFDVSVAMAEFRRCGITLDPYNRLLIDAYQTFVKMEPRDLVSALKFYTGETMVNAHDALEDILATIKVAKGQIGRYEQLSSPEDMFALMEPEKRCDIAGKFVMENGVPVFNFKYPGEPLSSQIGFLKWMLAKDFSQDTKDFITKFLKENGHT